MKRHPALRDISSDHHQGLVQARHLLQAAQGAEGSVTPTSASTAATSAATSGHAGNVALIRVARGFLAFWAEHTVRHFREEEEVLLPSFARYGDPSLEPVVHVLVEHVKIRRLVDDLQHQVEQGAPSSQTMHDIGETLRGHIRYEEAVLFPLIESMMPEVALTELRDRIAAFGAHQ